MGRRGWDDSRRMDPPDRALVWLGLLILAWVLFLGLGKAALQLCGWW